MRFSQPLKRSQIGYLLGASLLFCLGCDMSRAPSGEASAVDAPNANLSLPRSTLLGEIKINGSSTVQPISNAVREMFIQIHPAVNVVVGGDGTGNGFRDFYQQAIDIADASRPLKSGEWQQIRDAEIEFIELPIAYDGLTIAVHPNNTWVEQLTLAQLKKIFAAEAPARRWSDVDERWPQSEIKIFAPGTGSGTYDYFREVVAAETELREDMTLNEDDNVLVQGVAGNQNSIGFFGLAYYAQNPESLKAVPIVNPSTSEAFLPTTDNIASNRYAPFSRPLFIYVNAESLERAEVQTFVQFYLEHVPQLCSTATVDYVQLPPELYARTQAILDELQTGTHFIDNSGKARAGSFWELFRAENLIDISPEY